MKFNWFQILTSTVLPGSVSPTNFGSSLISLIFTLLNSIIISPGFIPALSDGLPFATLTTNAPLGLSNFSTSAISLVTICILTPNQPLLVSPYLISWSITLVALLDGIAKPIPIDPPYWL